MEAKVPDPEVMIVMIDTAMTETDNKKRIDANSSLNSYEEQFTVAAYSNCITNALQRQELISQQVMHLRVWVYLKQYLK